MEAANRGARDGKGRSIGCNIELPFEQAVEPVHRYARELPLLLRAQDDVHQVLVGVRHLPGGFGTLDELLEALTLIQTGKISHFPVVLFGKSYWGGLVHWLRDTVLADGKISPADLELMQVTDGPEEAAAAVVAAKHGT